MEVVIIVAVAANGVIGADGSIPWYYPEDLRRFKRLTTGHPVIMGRRTYESILADLGEPLPDRTNIVLTTSDIEAPSNVRPVSGVEAALDAAREQNAERVFVAGGESVYEAFLPLADRMERTELHEAYTGDTSFPDWDSSQWTITERETREDLDFVSYERAEATTA